jgi:hypothetical protein
VIDSFRIALPLWRPLLTIALTFAVTLTVYPWYLCRLPQLRPWCTATPLVLTTLFALSELAGRLAIVRLRWFEGIETWALQIALTRLVILVTFVVSQQGDFDIGEPYLSFLLVVPFGASHGFVTFHAASAVSGAAIPHGQAVRFITLAVTAGVAVGAAFDCMLPQSRLVLPENC